MVADGHRRCDDFDGADNGADADEHDEDTGEARASQGPRTCGVDWFVRSAAKRSRQPACGQTQRSDEQRNCCHQQRCAGGKCSAE
jgi:hypothetical protein